MLAAKRTSGLLASRLTKPSLTSSAALAKRSSSSLLRSSPSPSASNIALTLQSSSVVSELKKRGISGANDVAQMDRDTIVRLLHSLGTRTEVERYLRIFTNSSSASAGGKSGILPQAKFAVLK
jgi:N-acetyl-gamma-glutamyl-phosphate reductase/acetylglutamate kinase